MSAARRLRLGLPKGSLQETTQKLFTQAGFQLRIPERSYYPDIDDPEIECILVEDAEPLGPYGAKGVGEHSLIGTAPAIFGGIQHATGVRPTRTPATPDRVRALLKAAGGVR